MNRETVIPPHESRNHIRCDVCGTRWAQHTEECSRHAFRYLEACRRVTPAGLWQCCDLAGVANAACPFECGCHEPGGRKP